MTHTATTPRPKSRAEETLALLMSHDGIAFEREYVFAPPRRWRFDFAIPDRMVAIEVEGGTWSGGRHVRGAGYRRDIEKYNAAQALGWRVLRLTTDMVTDGSAMQHVRECLSPPPRLRIPLCTESEAT